MKIPVQVKPNGGAPLAVEYRWDTDTEILSAQLTPRQTETGMSGSVGLEGSDGSWLILDVASGTISGVEVAVWPDVQMRNALRPPAAVEDGVVLLSSKKSASGTASLEVETSVRVEADETERVFHFIFGKLKPTRTVRCASDLLLDVDSSNNLAGVWLLNVPPFPATRL